MVKSKKKWELEIFFKSMVNLYNIVNGKLCQKLHLIFYVKLLNIYRKKEKKSKIK